MGLTQKVIRKLGLGDAVCRLLAPIAADRGLLPSVEEARALLHALSPDSGGSCLCEREVSSDGTDAYDLEIVLPVFNVEKHLPACLDSIFSQETALRFRVIAVDDGSTDRSGAILDACVDPRLLVVHQENRGFSGARNTGLRLLRAPWVLFLDSDDMLAEGALSALAAAARDSGAAMVQGAYTAVDTLGKPLFRRAPPSGSLNPRVDCSGYFWGKLFRSELFSGLCLPDGYWYEDSMLAQVIYPRLEQDGRPVVGIGADTVLYRVNPQGISQGGRGSPKSLDSLWITLSLYRDRQRLGLENDRRYYEYLLNMLVLTWHRTEALGDDVGRAVFVLSREFLLREFAAFGTERPAYRMLEEAVRDGDYGRYRLFCSLH